MTTTPVLLSRRNTPVHPAIPDLDRLNARFESAHPVEVIRWAVAMFGDSLCLTTSFQDTLLVNLAVSVDPEVEVVFLDTGFHFAETLDVLRRAQSRYSLHLRVERPDRDAAALEPHRGFGQDTRTIRLPPGHQFTDNTSWLSSTTSVRPVMDATTTPRPWNMP